MAILRICTGNPHGLNGEIHDFDLGEPDESGMFDTEYGGNLYLFIDGAEYGSLLARTDTDGQITLTLGQENDGDQEWQQRNPVSATPYRIPEDWR